MSTQHIDTAQIAEAAYLLWLDEGRPEGRDQEHWFRAAEALNTPAKPARKPRAKAAAKPATKTAKPKAAPKPKAAAKPATARKPRKAAVN